MNNDQTVRFILEFLTKNNEVIKKAQSIANSLESLNKKSADSIKVAAAAEARYNEIQKERKKTIESLNAVLIKMGEIEKTSNALTEKGSALALKKSEILVKRESVQKSLTALEENAAKLEKNRETTKKGLIKLEEQLINQMSVKKTTSKALNEIVDAMAIKEEKLKKIKSESISIGKQISNVEKEKIALDKQAKAVGGELLAQNNREVKVQKELSAETDKLEKEKKSLNATEKIEKEQKIALAAAKKQAAIDTKNYKNQISLLDKEISKSNANIEKFKKQLGSISSPMQMLGEASRLFSRIAITVATVSAAFYTLDRLFLKVGRDFQEMMQRVAATAEDGMKNIDFLTDSTRKMAKETVFTASKIAEAQFTLAQAGLNTQEVLYATEASVKLAGGTLSDLDTVTGLLTSTIKTFGLDFNQSNRVIDVFAEALIKSKFTIESLTEAMKYGGTAGAAFGMTVEETVASLAQFVDIGLTGSLAGTALRQALNFAARQTERTKSAMESLNPILKENQKMTEGLKFTYDKLNPEINSFADIMENLTGYELSASQAVDIFGARSGAAIKTIVDRTRAGLIDIKAFTQSLTDADKVEKAQKLYEDMTDTINGRLKILLSATQEFQIQLFTAIGPDLQLLIEDVTLRLNEMTGIFEKDPGEMPFAKMLKEIINTIRNNLDTIFAFITAMLNIITSFVRLIIYGVQIVDKFGKILKVIVQLYMAFLIFKKVLFAYQTVVLGVIAAQEVLKLAILKDAKAKMVDAGATMTLTAANGSATISTYSLAGAIATLNFAMKKNPYLVAAGLALSLAIAIFGLNKYIFGSVDGFNALNDEMGKSSKMTDKEIERLQEISRQTKILINDEDELAKAVKERKIAELTKEGPILEREYGERQEIFNPQTMKDNANFMKSLTANTFADLENIIDSSVTHIKGSISTIGENFNKPFENTEITDKWFLNILGYQERLISLQEGTSIAFGKLYDDVGKKIGDTINKNVDKLSEKNLQKIKEFESRYDEFIEGMGKKVNEKSINELKLYKEELEKILGIKIPIDIDTKSSNENVLKFKDLLELTTDSVIEQNNAFVEMSVILQDAYAGGIVDIRGVGEELLNISKVITDLRSIKGRKGFFDEVEKSRPKLIEMKKTLNDTRKIIDKTTLINGEKIKQINEEYNKLGMLQFLEKAKKKTQIESLSNQNKTLLEYIKQIDLLDEIFNKDLNIKDATGNILKYSSFINPMLKVQRDHLDRLLKIRREERDMLRFGINLTETEIETNNKLAQEKLMHLKSVLQAEKEISFQKQKEYKDAIKSKEDQDKIYTANEKVLEQVNKVKEAELDISEEINKQTIDRIKYTSEIISKEIELINLKKNIVKDFESFEISALERITERDKSLSISTEKDIATQKEIIEMNLNNRKLEIQRKYLEENTKLQLKEIEKIKEESRLDLSGVSEGIFNIEDFSNFDDVFVGLEKIKGKFEEIGDKNNEISEKRKINVDMITEYEGQAIDDLLNKQGEVLVYNENQQKWINLNREQMDKMLNVLKDENKEYENTLVLNKKIVEILKTLYGIGLNIKKNDEERLKIVDKTKNEFAEMVNSIDEEFNKMSMGEFRANVRNAFQEATLASNKFFSLLLEQQKDSFPESFVENYKNAFDEVLESGNFTIENIRENFGTIFQNMDDEDFQLILKALKAIGKAADLAAKKANPIPKFFDELKDPLSAAVNVVDKFTDSLNGANTVSEWLGGNLAKAMNLWMDQSVLSYVDEYFGIMSEEEEEELERQKELRDTKIQFAMEMRDLEREIYNEKMEALLELEAMEQEMRLRNMTDEESRATLITETQEGLRDVYIGTIEERQLKLEQLKEQINGLNELENSLGMSRAQINSSSLNYLDQLKSATRAFYADKERDEKAALTAKQQADLAEVKSEEEKTNKWTELQAGFYKEGISMLAKATAQQLVYAGKSLMTSAYTAAGKTFEANAWNPILAAILAAATIGSILAFKNKLGKKDGGYIEKYAKGGLINGKPGIDNNLRMLDIGGFVVNKNATNRHRNELDSMVKFSGGGKVPALVSKGEYYIPPRETNMFGRRLEEINSYKGYQSGGAVTSGNSTNNNNTSSEKNISVNLTFTGTNIISGDSEDSIRDLYSSKIRKYILDDIENKQIG